MITLKENIIKQTNLLKEIERLSEPFVYNYNIPIKWKRWNTPNKKHLRNALKKYKRLTIVILKQSYKSINSK